MIAVFSRILAFHANSEVPWIIQITAVIVVGVNKGVGKILAQGGALLSFRVNGHAIFRVLGFIAFTGD